MSSNLPKILGRDPALFLAALAAAVYALTAFLPLSTDLAAAINAVAVAGVGVWTALVVKDGGVAAALGLVKALLALALGLGLHLNPEQQAAILTVVTAVSAAFVRTQVTAPVPAEPVGE